MAKAKKKNGDQPSAAISTADRVEKIIPSLQSLAIPIAELTPDAANARKHNPRNLSAIAASLNQFGQRKPVVAQRSGDALIVRAGNGTREAALSLGWTHLAVVVVDEDSTNATAYAIADNRTAELAEWDNDVLGLVLDSLDDDMRGVVDFNEGEIAALMARIARNSMEKDDKKNGVSAKSGSDSTGGASEDVFLDDGVFADTTPKGSGEKVVMCPHCGHEVPL